MASMDDLIKAIYTTPIIDNHAHPLLTPTFQTKYDLLTITTEAHGKAIKATPSSLSHIRAVNQLSEILGCEAKWEAVVKAIEIEKAREGHVWAKRCMEGIETILVDDGLDGKDEVFDYQWHDQLTRSKCKRIVRIEKVAEEIIDGLLKHRLTGARDAFATFKQFFRKAIRDAIEDPEVVGFKSVVCYRSGLDISSCPDSEFMSEFVALFSGLKAQGVTKFKRIDREFINWSLVNLTAELIGESSAHKKPFQFHTGLGDNDITLTRSSPAHLQGFIRKYPKVPIVLLHASYPWTQEAGYLATVYDNVYADIGEVFPFVSKEGQERVVREILELCPTEKILWSTDGHWFPETYLLAIVQVREALEVVLPEYVGKGALSIPQAIKAVEDIFFTTSNNLYDLKIPIKPFPPNSVAFPPRAGVPDLQLLKAFLEQNPTTKYLRLQYLDYTSTPRVRVIPVKRALAQLQANDHLQIKVAKAALIILPNDSVIPGGSATGEYIFRAILSSLRPGPSKGYASVQGEFFEEDGSKAELCPRSVLRRTTEISKSQGLKFIMGFEIEIVFMSRSPKGTFIPMIDSGGHNWNAARALRGSDKLDLLDEIYDVLLSAGIALETFHAESADGQYEFVLPPLPPLEAVDTLLHAREIITTIAANHSLRATLFPKPFENQPGTASHVHMSISSPNGDSPKIYESFYAGFLRHLPAIIAFTYSKPASFDRVLDGYWAGGRWVAWGTQNRETALRKVKDSHWEFKSLDGLANVYLAIAAILAAGTQGVADKEKMVLGDCLIDPGNLSEKEREELGITQMLPQNSDEAMKALAADEVMAKLLGKEVMDVYRRVKEAEFEMLGGMLPEERREWIIERY
ncbi:Protein fluG [Lachnellula suecica]|uniref:Protein fluG n=1 Tax=Lachnellula suecica TaxID=602035 RepID=A0A8T9C8N9_9HELO|nr:Protein fluG [Lachnellula suecica]